MATPVPTNAHGLSAGILWSPPTYTALNTPVQPLYTPLNTPGQTNLSMYQPQVGYVPQGDIFSNNTGNQALTEVLNKLSNIEKKLGKLDRIEEAVGKIAARVTVVEADISNLKERYSKIEESVLFMSDKFDVAETERKTLMKKINKAEKTTNDIQSIKSELRDMGSRAVDQEARSRRNNLIFTGIKENAEENCEHLVRNFMEHELQMSKEDIDNTKFHRVHRLGRKITPPNKEKPRAIIAGFVFHQDREQARKLGRQLKNKPFGMHEDFPKEIREARRSLVPELKELKRQGKLASIVYPAKLICEGKVVKEVNVLAPSSPPKQ